MCLVCTLYVLRADLFATYLLSICFRKRSFGPPLPSLVPRGSGGLKYHATFTDLFLTFLLAGFGGGDGGGGKGGGDEGCGEGGGKGGGGDGGGEGGGAEAAMVAATVAAARVAARAEWR